MEINKDELKPIRCCSCGRFLGLECIKVGVIKLKCKNCKQWTVLLGEETDLTNMEELVKMQ